MIEWGNPWVVLLLPLPWVVYRFLPPFRERARALRFPFFRDLVEAVGETPREGAVILRQSRADTLAAILVWLLLLVALAQPQRLGDPVEMSQAARDVILAIDISGSMDVQDFRSADGEQVQRLLAVKRVVQDFVEQREGDRVALIVFGTHAYVQSPFTEDLQTVAELLQQTEVGMAGPNTVIGDAIGLAIRTFEASDVQQRLLILLSDGTDTGSRMTPINAAVIAKQNEVSIYSIAVGDPDARPGSENRVDVATLREIAAGTGGEYYFAGDEDALQSVYQRIDQLAPRKTEVLSYQPKLALSHLPLGGASLLLLLYACARLLPMGRSKAA